MENLKTRSQTRLFIMNVTVYQVGSDLSDWSSVVNILTLGASRGTKILHSNLKLSAVKQHPDHDAACSTRPAKIEKRYAAKSIK